jgi:hypothetical protein
VVGDAEVRVRVVLAREVLEVVVVVERVLLHGDCGAAGEKPSRPLDVNPRERQPAQERALLL